MEETISLQELFKVIKKRLLLIISTFVLAVTIAGIISYFFLTPIYQASTQILINQKEFDQNQFNSQDIDTNLQLINTYNVIIKSPVILSKVIDNLDLNMTPDLLNKKITVNSEQNSQVINVSVEDTDSQKAVDIANMTADVFQEEIQSLMNVDNVNVLSPAINVNDMSPVKPKPILNMAIGAVIGLMLGFGLTFLLEYLDTTVKTEQDIEELLELPILGLISPISYKKIKKTKKSISPNRKRGSKVV
ncbi:Wzz/FepE/Etk N-terminal domain-containing protein [Psychrobacillus sp. FSL H8-0483]|uniref:YveK family protein n=1 Tax=Psychrobacillus sp. FSL H8-0483 TaxID=2921389 RepID=UPI00315A8534